MNLSTGVFFTSPILVDMTMKVPFIKPVVATIDVTLSFSATEMRLIIAKPLEVLVLPDGISWAFR